MKSVIANPVEALAILETFAQFDEISMNAIICMMIDTASAMHGESPVTIAVTITDAVMNVNDELGAYHMPVYD